MFPLGTVLFPYAVLPLHVFEPRYRVMTRRCLDGDGEFGVVLIERGSEVGGGDVRFDVGTIARIVQAAELPDGRFALATVGLRRFRVVRWLTDDPYPQAEVDLFEEPAPADTDIAARDRVAGAFGEVLELWHRTRRARPVAIHRRYPMTRGVRVRDRGRARRSARSTPSGSRKRTDHGAAARCCSSTSTISPTCCAPASSSDGAPDDRHVPHGYRAGMTNFDDDEAAPPARIRTCSGSTASSIDLRGEGPIQERPIRTASSRTTTSTRPTPPRTRSSARRISRSSKALEAELAEIEAALQRLDDGSYGVDEVTGEPIDPARLEALPTARTNVDTPH